MGRVWVHGATVEDGRIQALRVKMSGLPERTIDRDTTLAWMHDGHSFLPADGGPALVLVEVDGDGFVRADTAAEAADALPSLPPA